MCALNKVKGMNLFMINLLEQINKYIEEGYNDIYASAKVAQDIILSYLFNSKYKNNITIKGGVVMFNLTMLNPRFQATCFST